MQSSSVPNKNDAFFLGYSEEKIVQQLSHRLGVVLVPSTWIKEKLAFFHTPEVPDFRWFHYLPSLTRVCRVKLEKMLDSDIVKQQGAALFEFFQKYPPLTIEGWTAYSQIVSQLYPQEYPEVLKNFLNFWTEKAWEKEKEAKLVAFFKAQAPEGLKPAVQKKYQTLMMKRKPETIAHLVQIVPEFFPDHALIKLALKLAAKATKFSDREEALIEYRKLSIESQKHPLLSLGLFEAVLQKEEPERALQEWQKKHFPHHMDLALKLTLSFLNHRPLDQALTHGATILNPLIESQTDDWAEASLAFGLILYHEGKSPTQAFPYFHKLLKAFKENRLPEKKKIRLYVKALFFCGQCVRHPLFSGQGLAVESSQHYFEEAARYPALFYGQCASFLLHKKLVLPQSAEEKKEQLGDPITKKVYQIAVLFKQKQLQAFAQSKEQKGEGAEVLKVDCQEHIHTQQEGQLFVNLFQDWSTGATVNMARTLHYLKGFFFPQAYPVLQVKTPVLDSQLVHALIAVESGFNAYLESDAQARGLMQVWPLSGEEAAKALKVPFSLNKLWEKEYNILLGNHELKRWIKYFNGQYLYGIAAYNAGPYPVRRWIEKRALHRVHNDEKDLEQMIYWIERMGYPIVRIYVENILAAYAVYHCQSGVLTLKDWMQKPFFQ